MCKNDANKSVEQALIDNGFKIKSEGNFERVLDAGESLKLWKYIGLDDKLFCDQRMRILMLKNGTADAYIPKYAIDERIENGTIISSPSDVDKFNKEIFKI